ncbi:MAG TPA: helicase-associated domain-containing protein [Anaerolineaceae bacterium]|nr:helicase-associated domain-containing protein [Anaerolineaceae bacterium]
MRDLMHTLQGSDLGFLRIVANAWGIELNAPDAYTALPILEQAMLDAELIEELVEVLPPNARQALQALLQSEGRMPWAQFSRRYGNVRVMGSGKRDRERPDLKPTSPAEVLWYRALIGRAFINADPEPQEYAYIPEEFLEFLTPLQGAEELPLGRPASPAESAIPLRASDQILDHACTLLAALRLSLPIEKLDISHWNIPPATLRGLLFAANLIDNSGQPLPKTVRDFLAASRGQALAILSRAWLESTSFNELLLIPGLVAEGEWSNHPLEARKTVLNWLAHLPAQPWWHLDSFIAGIKERAPDFQRPAGDYDSWFIRKTESQTFLRGFTAWDAIDGALVRYLITGPLHWLGWIDLAIPAPGESASAFRPSPWGSALCQGQIPAGLAEEKEKLRLSADGLITAPRLLPRAARYQVARFTTWESETAEEYRYRLAPSSLDIARQQALRPAHLVTVLRAHCAGTIPPNMLQALDRWEKFGAQANMIKASLLRVTSPDVLTALSKSRAARHISEILSPTTALIRPGGETAIQNALVELGYLSDSLMT